MYQFSKKWVLKNGKWILLFLALLLFIVLLEGVYRYKVLQLDTHMYKFAVTFLRHTYLTPFMKFYTFLGSIIPLFLILLFTFFFMKNKKFCICMGSNLILITGINQILKFIVQRERPMGYQLINEIGYSFPSGHSMVSMAFYGLVVYLIRKSSLDKSVKNGLTLLLGITIFLIGFSRIYLGVHYASDVLAGFAVSLCYLIVISPIFYKFIQNPTAKS